MRHIFNYFNVNQLYKFASKEGFISRLRAIGARDEIISYVEGLEENLCGVVVGAVNKNKDVTLDQLKELVAKKERVEQLKKETVKQIEGDIAVEDERIKNWIVPQIKKDKSNRALFLSNLDKINKFLSENDIDLATYDLKSLLDYIDQVENFGTGQRSQDLVSQFLTKAMDHLNQKLLGINNVPLTSWAKRKAIVICKEWEKQIRKAMVEKPFEQLMTEAHKMKEDIDNGLYRGRELPNTPLRYGEYDSLVSNIEFLDDWHRNTSPDLKEYSVDRAIAASNQWHREAADSGKGLQYEKINRSNIVFGPDGWGDEENNGHFILELKSENDLKVEGAKMNHCVGGYGEKIKKGESRVFSLRHINNAYQPILTIETDSSGAIVRQDYGYLNQRISQKYHDMVTEWSTKNKIDTSKIEIRDIYRISDPDVLKEIVSKRDDPNILRSVVQNPAANQAVLEIVVAKTDNPYVLEIIAWHIEANQAMFEAIMAKTNNPDVLQAIARNPTVDQAMFEAIIAKTDNQYVLESIAGNPAANQNVLAAIVAKTNNSYILRFVAENPEANQLVLEAIMAKTNNPDVLQAIARNPTVDQAMFEAIMAKTDNLYVLESIAGNPAANQNVLEVIVAQTDCSYVLQSVAKNPAANQATLQAIIAKTKDPLVLRSIAKNPAANQATLQAITAKTDELYVLKEIAKNPAANQAVFEAIIINKGDAPDVLKEIAKNPAANQNVLEAIFVKLMEIVAEASNNPNKLDLLDEVAENPAANQAVFEAIMAKTDNPDVLESITKNPAANQNVIEAIIAKTKDPLVLHSIAENPAANQNVLEAIVAKTDDPYVLCSVAESPSANQAVFEAIMTKTDDKYTLRLIAENPAANQAILSAIMSKTNDPYVLNLVQSSIEALKQKPAIASASYIDLIYKRACRFERVSLKPAH